MNTDELVLATMTDTEWKAISELMVELSKTQRGDLFVPVARLQLHYALHRIAQTEDENEDELHKLRKFARGCAYNIAAFTWPGWDDSGPISQESQELGQSAARVTLDLASQTDDVTFNALWINGAHELNARNFDAAIKYFESTRDRADEEDGRCMAMGWIELSKYLNEPSTEKLTNLETAIKVLRETGQENGEFFAKQIETALDVYTREE